MRRMVEIRKEVTYTRKSKKEIKEEKRLALKREERRIRDEALEFERKRLKVKIKRAERRERIKKRKDAIKIHTEKKRINFSRDKEKAKRKMSISARERLKRDADTYRIGEIPDRRINKRKVSRLKAEARFGETKPYEKWFMRSWLDRFPEALTPSQRASMSPDRVLGNLEGRDHLRAVMGPFIINCANMKHRYAVVCKNVSNKWKLNKYLSDSGYVLFEYRAGDKKNLDLILDTVEKIKAGEREPAISEYEKELLTRKVKRDRNKKPIKKAKPKVKLRRKNKIIKQTEAVQCEPRKKKKRGKKAKQKKSVPKVKKFRAEDYFNL